MASRKTLQCDCKVVPIPTTEPTAERFSHYITKNRYKTIYQGQPSNIQITQITSTSAIIDFDKVGNPVYYELRITNLSTSSSQLYRIYTNNYTTYDLVADTSYEVYVVAHYISGDYFEVNHTQTFTTVNKWSVPTVSLSYFSNTTFEVTDNFTYVPIQLQFEFSPGSPSSYTLIVDETSTYDDYITHYLDETTKYRIWVRNDISSNIHVVTNYVDPTALDLSFSYDIVLPPYEEGVSAISFDYTPMASEIIIAYDQAPGTPKYQFQLTNAKTGITETIRETNLYDASFTLSGLDMDTSYSLVYQTIYETTTQNVYQNSNTLYWKTKNEAALETVTFVATVNSLTFTSENGGVGDISAHLFTLSRTGEADKIETRDATSTPPYVIQFDGLDTNTEYGLTIDTIYTNGNTYRTTNNYRTLYEGAPQHITAYTVTGTSVYLDYLPFTDATGIPSIPKYYTIYYTNQSTYITESINTYFKTQSVYNLLVPNTNYKIKVAATYSSGQSYEEELSDIITTSNEAAPKTVEVVDIKGDRVDLSWNKYDNIGVADDTAFIHIFDSNDICLNTVDISYSASSAIIQSLTHSTFYRFSIEHVYGANKYEKSVEATTDNEFLVQIERVIADGTSLEFFKSSVNNQDKYILSRTSEKNDPTTFEWSPKEFIAANDNTRTTSVDKESLYYSVLSKNGDYLYYFPNQTELHIYKHMVVVTPTQTEFSTTDDYFDHMQTVPLSGNMVSAAPSYDGTRLVLGYNSSYFDIYDLSANTWTLTITVTQTSTIKSREVFMSPDGTVCAISDEYAYSDGTPNAIFLYTISDGTSSTIVIDDYTIDNFYTQQLTKYVSFNVDGTKLALSIGLHTYPIDGTAASREHLIKIYEYGNGWTDTFDGTSAVFSYDGNTLAIANDYDISGGVALGSVKLYDINTHAYTYTIWGSTGNLRNYPMNRKVSMNDDATLVAISEYTYAYQYANERNGQIAVYQMETKNNALTASQLGVTLRQEDVDPVRELDNTLRGDWYGFYMEVFTDASDNNYVMTGTRPKASKSTGNFEGDVFVLKWQNPLFEYEITEWPFKVENLQPATTYEYSIISSYNVDPSYNYIFTSNYTTLSNQKPEPFFTIYNKRIDISWVPVPFDDTTLSVFYNLYVAKGNQILYDTSLSYIVNDGGTDISRSFISLSGDDFDYNTNYMIRFSSEYVNDVVLQDDPINVEYVGFSDTLTTLNESAALSILSLNNSENVVFDVVTPGVPFEHIIEISGNGGNSTYTLQDTDILDVSSLSLGATYDVDVTTNYTPTTSSLVYVAYKTQSYVYTTTITISNESFATDYIQNGRFLALDQGNYSDRFTATSRTRNAYSASRGIYLVERTDIANWSSSQYVYILENTDDVTPTHRELVVPDISYHLILYRSNDLTPGQTNDPAYAMQRLSTVVYPQYYDIRFYIANHSNSSAVYKTIPTEYFSPTIDYVLELFETTPSGQVNVFYQSSVLTNTHVNWNQFNIKLYLPQTHKNTDFRIRRLDNERNNLYISDVSMVGQREPFGLDPKWMYSTYETLWQPLENTSLINPEWTDVWVQNSDGYSVMALSSQMSCSFWFYTHDASSTLFWLGPSIFASTATFQIELDNNKLYISRETEDDGILSTSIDYGNTRAHHILVTMGQNGIDVSNELHVFLDGELKSSIYTPYKWRESLSDDRFYFGYPNTATVDYGITLKAFSIHDYVLQPNTAKELYLHELSEGQYGAFGNPNDLYSSRQTPINEVQGAFYNIFTTFVHGKSDITQNIKPNQDTSGNIDISGGTSLSFWLFDGDSCLDISMDTNTFLTIKEGDPFTSTKSSNHVSLVFNIGELEMYLNGYYYKMLGTYNNDTINTIDLSATGIYGLVEYDGIIFTQSQAWTAYVNFLRVYSDYTVSGGIYNVRLEFPMNYTGISNVSYTYSGFQDGSGTFADPNSDYDATVESTFTIHFSDLSLNEFHHPDFNSDNIVIRLDEYGMETTINASGPYIDYGSNASAYAFTEDMILNFTLKNTPDDTTYTYAIRNLVNTDIIAEALVGDISGDDFNPESGMSGDISRNIPVSLEIKEDLKIDRRKGYENFKFSIADLNLATLIEVYEQVYFNVTDITGESHLSVVNYDVSYENTVFMVSLYATGLSGDISYNVTGVDAIDVSGSLTGSFSLDTFSTIRNTSSGEQPVYVGHQIFAVNVDPNSAPDKYNLPFYISLTQVDLSYVGIEVIFNDDYNLQSSTSTAIEGTEFTITMRTPIANTITSFPYKLLVDNGYMSASDISGYNDISNGVFTFSKGIYASSLTFKAVKDPYNEADELFGLLVDMSNVAGVADLSVNVTIQSFVPTFIFSHTAPYITFLQESDTFTVTLDTSYTLINTSVSYELTGTINSSDISGGETTGAFLLDASGIGTVEFTIVADQIEEGEEVFTLQLVEFPDISLSLSIQDTSTYPRYDLSVNKLTVDEGDTDLTFTLTTENLEADTVDYIFSGAGIEVVDFLNITVLTGTFTNPTTVTTSEGVDQKIYTQTFTIRSDAKTEGGEIIRLSLVGNVPVANLEGIETTLSDVFIDVTINDTSQAPRYSIDTLIDSLRVQDTITTDTDKILTIQLIDAQNINRGVQIGYIITQISVASDVDIITEHANLIKFTDTGVDKYYGKFVYGYNEKIEFPINKAYQFKFELIGASFFTYNGGATTIKEFELTVSKSLVTST